MTVKVNGVNSTEIPEYAAWRKMKHRCSAEYEKKHLYRDKGIRVCGEWFNSFEAFYRDMGPRPSSQHSLDRIDTNRGYCKENCRWATIFEQNQNVSVRRTSKTGHRGVCFSKRFGWLAYGNKNGERSLFQYCSSLEEAVQVRKAWELKSIGAK